MAISNKFFIVPVADISKYQSYIKEDIPDLRKSLDETLYVMKLPFNQVTIPDAFSGLTVYNHNKILKEMDKLEWTNPII